MLLHINEEDIKMKEKYIAPAVEIIVVEATVNTFAEASGNEGTAVMLSWLID